MNDTPEQFLAEAEQALANSYLAIEARLWLQRAVALIEELRQPPKAGGVK